VTAFKSGADLGLEPGAEIAMQRQRAPDIDRPVDQVGAQPVHRVGQPHELVPLAARRVAKDLDKADAARLDRREMGHRTATLFVVAGFGRLAIAVPAP
jgi:hypothetical protein